MTFMREGTTIGVILARKVDTGDENYAKEGGEDAEEFADCEALDTHKGAEDEAPNTYIGLLNG